MINNFRGKYYFLSNYYASPYFYITYEDLSYPTVENAFQAAKSIHMEVRKQFTCIPPNEAKALGRKIQLRRD
jgi:predicted NAD-dependent protein-ADP-ribosyltransferase YbiA (DUF1768 family)